MSVNHNLEKTQSSHDSTPRPQVSGVIHMYDNGTGYNYSRLQDNLGNLVKNINISKYAKDINGSLEVLVATQIGDTKTAKLTHITPTVQSDVCDYRGIGSSGLYSYVFLLSIVTIKNTALLVT
jgi:hypothetical protein